MHTRLPEFVALDCYVTSNDEEVEVRTKSAVLYPISHARSHPWTTY